MERKEGNKEWGLGSGRRFEVSHLRNWYKVGVPEDHEVLIGRGRIKREGETTFGLGTILEIKGGPYEFNGRLVSVGREARVPFPQKSVKVAPRGR